MTRHVQASYFELCLQFQGFSVQCQHYLIILSLLEDPAPAQLDLHLQSDHTEWLLTRSYVTAHGEPVAPHLLPHQGSSALALKLQGEYTWWLFMLIGFAKLLTICLTVLSGFRGGFIFPLFFAGTAFGKGFALMPIAAFGHFPPVLFAMTIAAGAALHPTPLPACSLEFHVILSGVPAQGVLKFSSISKQIGPFLSVDSCMMQDV